MAYVIVALDVSDVSAAADLVEKIDATWYKIGPQLIYADGGLAFARSLMKAGRSVFLDAKLSDTPTTVTQAVRGICEQLKPHILSVRDGIEAAVEAAASPTLVAWVPSLTSDFEPEDVSVVPFATVAPAVVCRPSRVAAYKALGILTIVPGIAPKGLPYPDGHTEPFPACPEADFVVVGRAITRAGDPGTAYRRVVEEHYVSERG